MCWVCAKQRRGSLTEDGLAPNQAMLTTHFADDSGKSTDGLLPPDGVGDLKPPILQTGLITTADEAGGGIGVAPGNPVITVGAAPGTATTNTIGDQDFFQVTLEAGKVYEIGQYALAGGPNGVPQADAFIELYDAAGNLIVSADGGGPNTPSGLDALLTFEAKTSGTYYVNFRAFDQEAANGTKGDTVGDYTYFVREAQNAYRPYYDTDSPLYALDWGSQVNKINQSVRNPDGQEGPRPTGNEAGTPTGPNTAGSPGKNVITVYFAKAGEVYVDSDPTTPGTTDNIIAKGLEQFEIDAFMAAFASIERVADIDFVVVDGPDVYDELGFRANADFTFVTYPGTPRTGLLGRMSPPDEDSEGQAEFNALGPGWDANNLVPGGFSYVTLIHEMGHGLGMAHPHDNGGRSGIMRGVVAEGTAFDYTTGDFDLNQGVFTMMSYEDGWQKSPYGNASTSAGYGYNKGPMAFDIALLQDKYGVNEETARGNDTYVLSDVNARGTGYESIWDAAGTDWIVYNGARDSNIDLRPATLRYEEGGGGRVSYAFGIFGGFTIANGVTIENAQGGSGNDTITGNDAANNLYGGAGNDKIFGNGGQDFMYGGAGTDTLAGGTGDDFYYVDNGDIIIEADGEGRDSVYTTNGISLSRSASVEIIGLLNPATAPGATLVGSDTAQVIYGGAGNDALYGAGGNDQLVAGAGNDVLDGGAGADAMEGGDGGDIYFVDDGGDIVNEKDNAGVDYLYTNVSFTLGVGSAVENIAVANALGTGAIDLVGSEQSNSISGSNGANRIQGLAGSDFISAADGNDILVGGAGRDFLRGGAGADIFQYDDGDSQTGTEFDTIYDFEVGVDKIDLFEVDADTTSAGDGKFSFIGSNAFSGKAGELRVQMDGNTAHILGDTNGDGVADFYIVANGVQQPLTAIDFNL